METAELIEDAKCIDCQVPEGYKLSILISLFATIAGVSADPNTLMANAACLDCVIPPGMRLSVLISLADTIAGGGGGGSSGSVTCGAVPPVAAPTGSCGLYYDTNTTALYFWDGAAWQLKI